MERTMELDELKSAWQALDARLARHDRVQLELLREHRLGRARRNLRPLLSGMVLQALLGIGLVVLGVACWTNNLDAPGVLLAGIALHAFGVLHLAFAGMVTVLAMTLDYAAPVLAIQKRLRLLLRLQVLNSGVCGLPWWIMWVVVVVGFAGLGPEPPAGPTPAWIRGSLAVGFVGMLGTWAWSVRAARRPRDPRARVDDGADGIRRNLALFEDIESFERE